MLFYPNSVLQLRIPSVIDNAFYQFYASFSHALLLETKRRPANRIEIVMPDTAGKLPFLLCPQANGVAKKPVFYNPTPQYGAAADFYGKPSALHNVQTVPGRGYAVRPVPFSPPNVSSISGKETPPAGKGALRR